MAPATIAAFVVLQSAYSSRKYSTSVQVMSVKISAHDQWTMIAMPRIVAILSPPERSMPEGYLRGNRMPCRSRERTVKRVR